jgi:apolipoprotein N-acyltransferase
MTEFFAVVNAMLQRCGFYWIAANMGDGSFMFGYLSYLLFFVPVVMLLVFLAYMIEFYKDMRQ